MGLRDLSAFNKALLAKQDWMIIHNGESLLARTLKARYFPRGDFLIASQGYNFELYVAKHLRGETSPTSGFGLGDWQWQNAEGLT